MIIAIILFVMVLGIRIDLMDARERQREQIQRLQEIEQRTRQERLREYERDTQRVRMAGATARAARLRPPIREAERKAERLLIQNLSDRQQADYLANGGFYIRGVYGIYRIEKNYPHSVHGFRPNGDPHCSYGYGVGYSHLYSGHRCHPGDEMLSKKLSIEADEAGFLNESCTSPPRTYRTVDMSYLDPPVYGLLSLARAPVRAPWSGVSRPRRYTR